ncbi:hypothetical protein FPOA_11837 [Fusarium poae]|uniref:DNA2/NAM7 helicase-like C-terminal domain-containing protein n=1 Tax=Fusarium poae TaxID=36050 RepID=A0A1B8AHU3_FUSPO|nr:hypothetical protein FPOA_11837 [Fusarium poae]
MAKLPKQVRCTLLIPDPSKEGVWGCIPSLGDEDTSVFVNLTPNGIRLSFPRDADRSVWAWYSSDLGMSSSTLHHIAIELRGSSADIRQLNDDETKAFEGLVGNDEAESFRIVTFNSKPDEPCSPRITGFGTPFHGVDATVDGYVNHDTQICGVASLSEILQRQNFTILVKDPILASYISDATGPRKSETFGYGEVHDWDMARYGQQIPKLRGCAFGPTIRFENANERDTALTQMHVQDRVGKEPVEKTTEFVCLLEPQKAFELEHWRAARRALRGDSCKLDITFKPTKGAAWSVTWEASHLTFASSDHLHGVDLERRLPLLLKRPVDGSRSHNFCPDSSPEYEGTGDELKRSIVKFRCHLNLNNEAMRVSAINYLSNPNIWPSAMESVDRAFIQQTIFNELLIGQGLWPLQKQGVNVKLPSFDIFDGIPADVLDVCLSHVFGNDKERVQRYFSKLYLGLGLVSGPPGTGKSHLASIIVILMCFNKSIKHVYVSAASNGATDNIVERIDGIAKKITAALAGSHVKNLMLLRGYSLGTEVGNCTEALLGKSFKEDAIWNPSPWNFGRSLCWWTLRVLGSERAPHLTADDNAELWDLQQKLSAIILPFSSSSTKYPRLVKFRQLVRLAKGLESASAYQHSLTGDSHKRTLIQLMELVVGCADVVATTPATSTSWIYRSFNHKKAQAVVFDEAATMFCSDGLLVCGNTPRPMVAIGDPKQLAPNLATAFELLHGNRWKHDRRRGNFERTLKPIPTNRFAQFANISWLSWFIYLGWPVFHLYTQHRMANSLFDISLKTVYKSLVPHFKYSPMCHPNNFSVGLKVEQYLKIEYRIKPSPENTIQPVFFHCTNSPCREYEDSLSRLNPRQADLIAEFLVKMISKLKLPPEDIVVLTPYRANIGAIGRRFRKERVLKGVEFTSFNRFQGREAQIVVLALCVDAETGPMFVAEERSLNVALTRQRSSLLIFGDINTPNYQQQRSFDPDFDTYEEPRINQRVFKEVFHMIRTNGRIVSIEGKEKADPDSRWATRDTMRRSRPRER